MIRLYSVYPVSDSCIPVPSELFGAQEQSAQVQEKVESVKLALLNQRQENEKLSMQVVHSPDKLRSQV